MTPGEQSLVVELTDEFGDDFERVEQPVITKGNMLYVTFNEEDVTDADLRGKTFRIVVEEVV